jgi:peptide-methionine (R)-S-oxide reductase
MFRLPVLFLLILTGITACGQDTKNLSKSKKTMKPKINKPDSEWEKVLTPQQFYILRKKGTDLPGTGKYTYHFEDGIYKCAACGAPLFKSNNKYESHCGWPSFDDAIPGAVIMQPDYSHNMIRTEIICANCGGHLGHIFDDGPQETTGKRYCVNSSSLNFVKKDSLKQ